MKGYVRRLHVSTPNTGPETMHGEPEILYPSVPRSRSLPARARRAARHRIGRVRENVEPVVRGTWEIRCSTGRSAVSILRQLFAARRSAGIPVRTFLANRMWDVPQARWNEFVSAKELDALVCHYSTGPHAAWR